MNRELGAVALAMALCACGSSSSGAAPDGGTSSATGFTQVPAQHRPSDAQCTTARPAAGCGFPGGTCSSDATCASDGGPNGRCIEPSTNVCTCSYDACSGDSACPASQTCACHGSPYTGSFGNTCTPGQCRVDSDCGAKGYCSPSPSTTCGGTGPALAGYYCHTAMDLCVDDNNCPPIEHPTDPNNLIYQTCGYSTSAQHWQCQPAPICGG
jgi:hypothetical protein